MKKTKPAPKITSVIKINDEESGEFYQEAKLNRNRDINQSLGSNFSQNDSIESEKSAQRNFDLPARYTVSKTVKNNNFLAKDETTEVKKRAKSPRI